MANYVLYRDCYEALGNAVIIRAAYDYRRAWKQYRKGNKTALGRIQEIEKFFNSEWASLLSRDMAKVILERLQKEQEEKTKKSQRPKRTVKISKRNSEA